jgi:hypothetical protein
MILDIFFSIFTFLFLVAPFPKWDISLDFLTDPFVFILNSMLEFNYLLPISEVLLCFGLFLSIQIVLLLFDISMFIIKFIRGN